jgi:HlyD family secretion protein
MNTKLGLAAAALVALGSYGCVDRQAQQQAKRTQQIVTDPVQTVAAVPAKVITLTQNLEVTGDVTTSSDSQIGAKTTGRVVTVNVSDGDHVTAGQVVAVQDTAPLQAQLAQAQAGVLTAQASLAQAESSLTQAVRNATINPSRSTAAVLSARASLKQAQANLTKELTGARPQERSQAVAALSSAKANMDMNKKQLDRIKILVEQGALAGSQLDQQEATYESALATYQSAKESLDLLQVGNREEDIDTARDQVAQAEQALQTSEAAKKLDPLYEDQVAAARAGVASARASVTNAQQQVILARQAMSDAVIRSPFDGQVSGKPVEAGTIAGPGTTIMRIIGGQGIYFEGNVPSNLIDRVTAGQPVSVTVSESGSKAYEGKVAAISPLGSSIGRLFTIRVKFVGTPGEVRPGMFATGEIQVQSIPGAVMVPIQAIEDRDGKQVVYIATHGVAKKVVIQPGLKQGDLEQVKGVDAGAQVIIQGQDRLSDGAKVNLTAPVGITAQTSVSSRQG